MKIATVVFGIALLLMALLVMPGVGMARGSHRGMFGGAHHGHPINAWMGSHRQRLR